MGSVRKQVLLRPAMREDARAVAELFALAGDGISEWLWRQQAGAGHTPFAHGASLAAREDASFSYRHAVLAMAGDRVAGMVLAYRLPDPSEPLDATDALDILRPLLALERQTAGSYYINAIATYPAFRRLGVGSALLEQTYADARAAGADTLSLIVFEENQKAVILYRSQGFQTVARARAVPHEAYPYRGDLVLMKREAGG